MKFKSHLKQIIEAKRAAKPSESDLKIWYAGSGATNGTMQPTYWSLTDMWKRSKASKSSASWIAWQKLVDAGKVQGVKEEQEYIERLESALESIAEELECSVEDLLEDLQTPQRAAQSNRMVNNAWLHANTTESDKAKKRRNRKYHKIFNKQEMESKSKKTYGMGGKIVKKAKVQEDYQNFEREEETTKELKNLKRTTARRLKTWAGLPNPHSPSSYDAGDRYVKARKKLSDKVDQVEKERTHPLKRFGKGGKVVHGSLRSMFKKAKVQEDYQTRERDREMANTGQLGSSLDSNEKASKKVYGKGGKVAHQSLRAMIKKAKWTHGFHGVGAWKDEKNRLADRNVPRNSAEVKEDYQTRERDREMANTGQLGSSLDSNEKASKKVYGKGGKVAHQSLRAMIKKANWKDEKNRLADRNVPHSEQ